MVVVLVFALAGTAFAGPTDIVVFGSPALEQAICDFYGFTPGTITEADMATVTFLAVSDPAVTSLQGLQYASSLDFLDISGCQVGDLGPLSGLISLTYLQFENNIVSDITPLAGLVNLTYLDGNFNQVTDISPVGGMTALKELYFDGNEISDVSPIAGLTGLTGLALGTNIKDITPLAGLSSLNTLVIPNNYLDVSAGTPARNTIDAIAAAYTVYTPQKTALVGTVTSGGSPVSGVTVTVGALPPVTSGADGTYVIDIATPGPYTVTFAKSGYTGSSAGVTIVAGETETKDASLALAPVVSTPASSPWSLSLLTLAGLGIAIVARKRFAAC